MNAELKSLSRKLKTFPAKSSNLKSSAKKENENLEQTENLKTSFQEELKNIKNSIQNSFSDNENKELGKNVFEENLQTQENGQKQPDGFSNDSLLGDLLGFLRTNRLMSTLMICRQIERIDVLDGVASLFSSVFDLSELVQNEKHKAELDKFFKSKGLSFKLFEKTKQKDPIDLLREFFGERLVVR